VIGQIETLDQRTDVVISQAGAIADVLVLDGQFVEYGQKLLSIEPTVT
jgi:biotin carboxyl carrier protein